MPITPIPWKVGRRISSVQKVKATHCNILRPLFLKIDSLYCNLSCYNKIAQTGKLIKKNRNFVLTGWEGRKFRIEALADSGQNRSSASGGTTWLACSNVKKREGKRRKVP